MWYLAGSLVRLQKVGFGLVLARLGYFAGLLGGIEFSTIQGVINPTRPIILQRGSGLHMVQPNEVGEAKVALEFY